MGIGSSKADAPKFTVEELDVYEACTVLSAGELYVLLSKFHKLGGVRHTSTTAEAQFKIRASSEGALPKDVEATDASEGNVKVTMRAVISQPEFAYNPFAESLCRIFTSEEPGSETYGDLDFDEFVDLYNVLSPRAKKETKIQTAFRLYDFNGDGYLDPDDLKQLLRLMVTTQTAPKGSPEYDDEVGRQELSDDEMDEISERVMRECDIDGNGRLSYAEFAKVLGRLPDFQSKFRVFIQ